MTNPLYQYNKIVLYSESTYLLGLQFERKKYITRVVNGDVRIRVGGGWVTLDEFVQTKGKFKYDRKCSNSDYVQRFILID